MDYLKYRRTVTDQIDSRQAPKKSGRQAVPLLIDCYCGTAGDHSGKCVQSVWEINSESIEVPKGVAWLNLRIGF